MKIPLSWLKTYIDIDLNLEQLAQVLTMTGLEVEGIHLAGLPRPELERYEFSYSGLSWPADKFVVAEVREVFPHPNADRLVLCALNDGTEDIMVLTGAPDLYPYKGTGKLEKPLKVAYAREGAQLYDGHQPGRVLTQLKRAKIRGVDSFSMVCSEKELGISDEHEGIILLDEDAIAGTPLVDYMGDAVFEISILPNMVRNASVMGIARELSAITGKPLHITPPQYSVSGSSVLETAAVQITDPVRNPRFMLGLVRNVDSRPSPYWVQRRLRLAGMRPINAVVDATNYVMLETGEPLHAFDYDLLVKRAGGKTPTIITRGAEEGEKLITLDHTERTLHSYTTLVADTAGALSLAGVMGGLESEVTPDTRNILLEAAAWNFINIRKTVNATKLNSEASYRNSRGVHPALAEVGLKYGLQRLADWAGGQIAPDVLDEYPLPHQDTENLLTTAAVKRILGLDLSPEQIASLLQRLEFKTCIRDDGVLVTSPAHRLDIGTGIEGEADLLEELARLYGYDNIPEESFSDALPPAYENPAMIHENHIKDMLTVFGLQEVITYRFTSPEREARLSLNGEQQPDDCYVKLQNPIASDKRMMRRSLLNSVLEVAERNIRLTPGLALYEIGPQFIPVPDDELPDEAMTLAIVLTGSSAASEWDRPAGSDYDFYDLKGIIEALLENLHIEKTAFVIGNHELFHPGKNAQITAHDVEVGIMGELHPVIKEHYDLGDSPVLAAVIDLKTLIQQIPELHGTRSVPLHPPVLEDLAVIVDENIPAVQVEETIRQAGGKLLQSIRLFDLFRGRQIGEGKKSLAYNLTYQAEDQTLTDKDAAQIRNRIIRRLEHDLNAVIRK